MIEIPYPKKSSEAEIQAMLWQKLRDAGLDARLEVSGVLENKMPRMDIVVFKDQIAICIIECKSWTRRYSKEFWYQKMKNSKQLDKYRLFGIPVSICGTEASIPTVCDFVNSIVPRKD